MPGYVPDENKKIFDCRLELLSKDGCGEGEEGEEEEEISALARQGSRFVTDGLWDCSPVSLIDTSNW